MHAVHSCSLTVAAFLPGYDASSTSAESLQSEDTVYSADSIEFSPVQHDIFVCGTYQIQKLEEAGKEEGSAVTEPSDDDEDEPETGSAPKTKRLGRALVYQVAQNGQSLYVAYPLLLQMQQACGSRRLYDDLSVSS